MTAAWAVPEPGDVLGTAWAVALDGEYVYVYESPFMYGMAQHEPDEVAEEVELVADPGGDYLGWLDDQDPVVPAMVKQRAVFPIQFAYPVADEEAAGKGISVGLSLRGTGRRLTPEEAERL